MGKPIECSGQLGGDTESKKTAGTVQPMLHALQQIQNVNQKIETSWPDTVYQCLGHMSCLCRANLQCDVTAGLHFGSDMTVQCEVLLFLMQQLPSSKCSYETNFHSVENLYWVFWVMTPCGLVPVRLHCVITWKKTVQRYFNLFLL
jgi:hypothetical protein